MNGGWQLIETAPRDGSPILLYGKCDGEICGEFGPLICVGRSDGAGFDVEATDYYSVAVIATHWQPLPEPPQ